MVTQSFAEIARRLHDATAFLRVAIGSRDAATLEEGQQGASAALASAFDVASDGGLMPLQSARLGQQFHILAELLVSSTDHGTGDEPEAESPEWDGRAAA